MCRHGLRKFDESELDGMILAYAGVYRLGLGERVSELIPFEIMLPAVGQGAVAIEIRSDDQRTAAAVAKLNHQTYANMHHSRTCISSPT